MSFGARLRAGYAGLVRRWLAVTALLALTALPALAASDPGCTLLWQVQPQFDTTPRQLRISLRFETGTRQTSTLRLPGGWAAMRELAAGDDGALADHLAVQPRLQAVPGAPALRSLSHAAGERVQLHWRWTPPVDALRSDGVQLAEHWLAFSGAALLPLPDGTEPLTAGSACIQLNGLPAGGRWVSSLGRADASEANFRLAPDSVPLAVRVQQSLFAGGALQWAMLPTSNPPLTVVMPADAGFRFDADSLARASAEAIVAQRRQWADMAPAPPWLLLMLPMPRTLSGLDLAAGSAWHQGLALQADAALSLPGATFDALITSALLRARVAERFGPLAYAGRGDEALRAWFSEGWTDYLSHRSLLRTGQWTLDDYAAAINRKFMVYLDHPDRQLSNVQLVAGMAQQPALSGLAAARGEWLALHWHQALRAAGQPGLETLMRQLQVPPSQARRAGPISAPLATHRLLAALRPALDEQPLRDIQRHIDQGEPFNFDPALLGPCFIGERALVPSWRLGFDAASLGSRRVTGVQPGGPAAAAGLRDGMRLISHSLVPGDPSQPVILQVQDEDGGRRELRWWPAGDPVRELPRYRPVANAMNAPACQGWLGLGPMALGAARAAAAPAAKSAKGSRSTQAAAAKSSKATKPKTTKTKTSSKPKPPGKAARPAKAANTPRQR